MEELIKVNYDSDRPTVLGRDLHKFLEIKTDYMDWFPRMLYYGFAESVDYIAISQKREIGIGKGLIDHQLTLEMAKEISMIQRNAKGKEARLYFIECEKKAKAQLSRIDILKLALEAEEKRLLTEKRNALLEKTFEKIEDNLPHDGEYTAQFLAQKFGVFSEKGLPHSAVINYLLGSLDPNYDYHESKKNFVLYSGNYFREVYTCAPTGTRYKEMMYNQRAYDALKINFDNWLRLSNARTKSGLRVVGYKRKYYYKLFGDDI